MIEYPPLPAGPHSKASKALLLGVKYDHARRDGEPFRDYVARHVVKYQATTPLLVEALPKGCIVVPVPRCSESGFDRLWPTERFCRSLVAAGAASECWPGLKRVVSVPSQRRAGSKKNRTGAERHMETMATDPVSLGMQFRDVVLVDDVLTSGETMLGCYARLVSDGFDPGRLHGFCLAADERTNGTDYTSVLNARRFRLRTSMYGYGAWLVDD